LAISWPGIFWIEGLCKQPEIKKKNTNTSGSIGRDDVCRGYFNDFPAIETCGVSKKTAF